MDDPKILYQNCFAEYGIYDRPTQKSLINALICCFRLPTSSASLLEKAIHILEALFQTDLSPYLPKDNAEAVITELLYTLYYEGLPKENIQFLLLQIAGQKASIHNLVQKLSPQQKLEAIAFAFRHYREGSNAILSELTDLKPLIYGLKQHYYNLESLSNGALLEELEDEAQKQTTECFALFSELVPLVQRAILKVYDSINLPNSKTVVQHKEQSAKVWKIPYSPTTFQNFTRLFGLRAYPPVFIHDLYESDELKDKLARLCTLLKSGQALTNIEIVQIYSFVSTLLRHIGAAADNAMLKTEFITPAIATCGKDLSKSPALISLIESYQLVASDLAPHPIFIYDQSDKPLYERNKRYINRLNKEYGSRIQSLSKDDVLMLAKKLQLTALIDTSPGGNFGFGGARNCQYLLTGLLKAAYNAKKNLKQLLALPDEEIAQLFKTHVLESPGTLLLLDDDIELPKTAIFSSALLTSTIGSEYNSSVSYQYGRQTIYGRSYWSLEQLVTEPEKTQLFAQWSNLPLAAGISGYTCKPKICLNLPHGCEERHLWQATKTHFPLKPLYHLSGSRYPSGAIPTAPFVGIGQYLKGNLPYVFLVGMVSTLVDPSGTLGQCSLPWNDEVYHDVLASLKDALEVMAKKETQEELSERFLQNIRNFFGLRYSQPNAYLNAVQHLMHTRIHVPQAVDPQEQKSLNELASIYTATQEDLRLFWRFGSSLSMDGSFDTIEQTKTKLEQETKRPLSHYPITQGFYLLARSLGNGEFCMIIRNLLSFMP